MSRADVRALVERGARFAVTCHRRPDADALGSALGWAAILRALGKHADVYSVDPVPRTMRFLDAVADVPSQAPEGDYDACFVMDAAARALVPELPSGLDGPVVLIDHHAAHDDYGDLVLREVDACATALVVLRMVRELGLEAVPEAAVRPLYAAIVSDTGGFRYSATTAETHRWVAELLDAGAEPWVTAYHLFEAWEPARMKLLSAVLEGLEVVEEGRVAILRVTQATLARVGGDDQMVEGMVNYGRMLEGVEIAVLLWEQPDGQTKVSLRASGAADVGAVATSVGGGGHRAAAGATVDADLPTTGARILESIRRALEI